ncbi:MAG: hypothetical protein K940chlam2_00581 [Chlamydiae bacterium]|nr:hypothetical protein [Chlamydiota bacterium]
MSAKVKYIGLTLLLPILFLALYPFINKHEDCVTVAILAKDKAQSLPLYLKCLEKQTWPKEKTYLYIRTNNNSDETASLLEEWIKKIGHRYAKVHYDDSSIDHALEAYKQHEWNTFRFKILAKIRQESVDWARAKQSHYFVADCDNFIIPETIERLVKTELPIVAPFLRTIQPSPYSNFHAAVDENGYFANSNLYTDLLGQTIKGLVEVPVVHCTYLIRNDVLDKIAYDDESGRYEYVIFSDTARKEKIPQYLDNRKVYGRITFAETVEEFENEYLGSELCDDEEKKMAHIFTKFYQEGIWARNGEGKGSSGEGSTVENTITYRTFLQNFLKEHEIKTVVDGGCGDWEFSQELDWEGISYIGYDVVKEVIESNEKKFAKPHIQFINQSFLTEELPPADLFICKDVFQHLSTDAILAFLPNLKKFKFCLICNDIDYNVELDRCGDTEVGGYRPIDLTKAPFNLQAERVLTFPSGWVVKTVYLIRKA